MISKEKTRIIITVSKRTADFLESTAKKMKISKSRLITILMSKNVEMIYNSLDEKRQELIKEAIKIAKINWLD